MVRDAWAAFTLVVAYYATVAFRVRRELDRCRARAAAIPTPELRRFALDKLAGEHLNAEAAAVFATLAPVRHRRAAARLLVAFEVMYDYLDAVSEETSVHPVENGLQLHQALTAAVVDVLPAQQDFYAMSDHAHDGGYLDGLIASCREAFAALPAADAVRPVLARCVERCGAGQTRTHAVHQFGVDQLRDWAGGLAASDSYAWWERASGSASSLVLHALFAAAGDARTAAGDAERIERAYFPSICALSTLLDALIDRSEDAASGSHNYLHHYPSTERAGARLRWIARDADESARQLPRGMRHAAIARGVSAFYLSAALSTDATTRAIARGIISSSSPATVRPLVAIVRWKRRLAAG